MAIGQVIKGGHGGARQCFQPIGGYGSVIVIHDSLKATANTSGELLNPTGITSSNFHWVRRSPRMRAAYVSARYTKAATVTTDPVVGLVGAFPIGVTTLFEDNTSGPASDDTWYFKRLDQVTATATTGLTLDLVSSGTGLMVDSTYAYTDDGNSGAAIDLQDCWYFGMVVITAAVTNTGVCHGLVRTIA